MMQISRPLALLFIMFFSSVLNTAQAVIDSYEFATADQEQRFFDLTTELRCPKCQNQSISDSNSTIAHDLRREVHRLLIAGAENKEVIDFMLSRYGEFVLYTPRFEMKTLVLWLGPLFFLLLGLAVLVVVVRSHRRASGVESATSNDKLRPEQLQTLEKALAGKESDFLYEEGWQDKTQ